jgi:hypothetical protein
VQADPGGELTSDVRPESTNFWSVVLIEGTDNVSIVDSPLPFYYRCVTQLLN